MRGFKPLTLTEALPRLAAAVNQGRLVPFTGAGISAPSLNLWPKFASKLCEEAAIKSQISEEFTSSQLIRMSERAIDILTRQAPLNITAAVKKSLGYISGVSPKITDQCIALSEIWWPLILTTNYDDLLVSKYENISIFGRSSIDCHSLLSHLAAPSGTAYWALQGYLGNSSNGQDLQNEIVIGHRQYRKATFNNLIFRSTFGEIFRNYSLLFVGSNLSEDYILGLFGEVLEKYGNNTRMHCALFSEKDRDSVDHHFLHTRLNIVSVFYDDAGEKFKGLPPALAALKAEVNKATLKHTKSGFYFANLNKLEAEKYPVGLEISASEIYFPSKKDCVVVSAGKNGQKLMFSNKIRSLLSEHDKDFENKFMNLASSKCWQLPHTNIYAIAARKTDNALSPDLRDIREVTKSVFEALTLLNGKYHLIHMMLLSAGAGRNFPSVFSLIAMLRGFKTFLNSGIILSSVLKIHVVDPSVTAYIRTHTLQIEEILSCNDIQLRIEIYDPPETERFQIYLDECTTMKQISGYYAINRVNWAVEIIPAAYVNQKIETDSSETLSDLGLIPGSTVRYSRLAHTGETSKNNLDNLFP